MCFLIGGYLMCVRCICEHTERANSKRRRNEELIQKKPEDISTRQTLGGSVIDLSKTSG